MGFGGALFYWGVEHHLSQAVRDSHLLRKVEEFCKCCRRISWFEMTGVWYEKDYFMFSRGTLCASLGG